MQRSEFLHAICHLKFLENIDKSEMQNVMAQTKHTYRMSIRRMVEKKPLDVMHLVAKRRK